MFDFTGEDLKLNQRGLISPRQKDWLGMTARGMQSCSWSSALIAVFFLFLGLGITLTLYLQNESSRAALFSNRTNIIAFPTIALLVLGILALSLFLTRRQANRIVAAQLQATEGNAHLEENSDSDFTSYLLVIGKKKFTFADDVSNTFKEGKQYKVYFCKSGIYEFVLSLEQVND